jgi:1-acyl-sn-glycerol-3-phosphate acyltransferase
VTLDGFAERDKDAFVAFSDAFAKRCGQSIDRVGRRLHVEVEGIDRLPHGRAVLVANHAFGVWDLALVAARIRGETGRTVWALGEHLWWRVPIVRRLACAVGVVDGTNDNIDALLGADQLVLVLPGGIREAMKPRELRYRLLWGHHYGFVRGAIRNDAPLVPLACIGGDDLVDLRGNAFARGRKLHLSIPVPIPVHFHRAHLRFVVGEPIDPRGRDEKSLRREVEGAIHELFEEELSHRVRFAP